MSVSEKGILQPILIRPNGNGHLLVCGERRFRAASAAGLIEIPAVIRELTDEEALELQIIENLQRKDVHPMEEAVAFKSLLDKGKDIKEIAARVGKSEFFVRQRIKLCSLTNNWQQLFYANRLNVTDALKVSLFDEKIQQQIFESYSHRTGKIELQEWDLRDYRGDLLNAAFDITDPTLDRKMGPCTYCQFNSSVSSLFPEDSLSPKCTFISCFKHKSDVHFDRELKTAKEDPAMLFVDMSYGDADKKLFEALKKDGFAILKKYTDFDSVDAPRVPDWSEFADEDDEDYNEADARKNYQQYVERYEKDKQIYDKKISTGKLKKAFAVAGKDKAKYVYIELRKTGNQKSSKAAVDSGDAAIADIDGEISRIQDRNKRSIELDGEKVHAKIVDQLKIHPSMKDPSVAMDDAHRKIMLFLLHEHLGYDSELRKKLKISDAPYNSTLKLQKAWIDKVASLTDPEIAFMIRKIALHKYSGSLPQQTGGATLRILAETFSDIDIASLEAEQGVVATRRQAKIDKRIAELKVKKKELTKESSIATKSKTNKKIKS